MTDVIRHGYIGVAGIAKNHAGKLSEVPGVVHHAAADIKQEPLDAFAERFEVPRTASSTTGRCSPIPSSTRSASAPSTSSTASRRSPPFLEIANRPDEVLCPWGDWDHATWETEDLATAFVRFADGATMHIESSFAAHVEKNRANVEIMGTVGGARYDPLTVFTDLNGYMVDVTPNYIGKEDGFAEKMRFFAEHVRGGPNLCPGDAGRAVQKSLDGIYASARTGCEVVLD